MSVMIPKRRVAPLARTFTFAVGALAVGALASLGSLGCEVSVFGSEPIQLAGGVGPSFGGEAGACGEPEDTRQVRERLRDGEARSGEGSPCVFHCVFEDGRLTDESREGCALASVGEDGVVQLDMSQADALVASVEVCEGTVLHLGDSRGARADGGDDPSTSHDASVLIRDGALALLPAHGGSLEPSRVEGYRGRSAEPGSCTPRTIVVTDSVVYLADLERGLCGASMLRIDPPTDEEGRPDALFHLALGRSLDGEASGSAPPRVDLCFF